MGQRSPLVTLAAAAVGLVALLVVDSRLTGTPAAPAGIAAATSAPTTAPATSAPASTPPTSAPAGSSSPQPSRTTAPAQRTVVYIGRTAAREATVAVAVRGNRAVAYVCDGRRLEAWLIGTFTSGRLVLRSRTGEHLTAVATAKTASGELTLHGRSLRFTATPAGPPASLYRARSRTSTIGWIILPSGRQVGIDNDGTPAAAPPLDPATRSATVNGAAVTAQPIAGDETF